MGERGGGGGKGREGGKKGRGVDVEEEDGAAEEAARLTRRTRRVKRRGGAKGVLKGRSGLQVACRPPSPRAVFPPRVNYNTQQTGTLWGTGAHRGTGEGNVHLADALRRP